MHEHLDIINCSPWDIICDLGKGVRFTYKRSKSQVPCKLINPSLFINWKWRLLIDMLVSYICLGLFGFRIYCINLLQLLNFRIYCIKVSFLRTLIWKFKLSIYSCIIEVDHNCSSAAYDVYEIHIDFR